MGKRIAGHHTLLSLCIGYVNAETLTTCASSYTINSVIDIVSFSLINIILRVKSHISDKIEEEIWNYFFVFYVV